MQSHAEPALTGQVPDPDEKLGSGWKTSKDRAVTAAADSGGLKILVADSGRAYAWKTVASLSEPGLPADSWIGNQCVIDHDHAAVVYAPRTFTNKPDLMQGGAFAAIVNLGTGQVTKLPFTASLAYFDPSCNPQSRTAAFTAFRDMNDPAETRTRVVIVNTAGRTLSAPASKGEITSAVPVDDGAIGAIGRRLIHLDRKGRVEELLTARGVPFDVHPVDGGKVAFVERDGSKRARARVWSAKSKAAVVAEGKLGDLDLARGGSSQVFLVGHPVGAAHTSGSGITRINAPVDTDISSLGRLAVNPVLSQGMRAGVDRIENAGKGFTKVDPTAQRTAQAPGMLSAAPTMTVTSTATGNGTKLSQKVTATLPAARTQLSPALASVPKARAAARAASGGRSLPVRALAANVSHDPTDPDRWCSVSRNDVNAQALQPTPNQVEWAVDMAIRGDLHAGYVNQGGYRNQTGMGTIDPQGLFKAPTLTGAANARIPANVMLGIMAQESNLWQAEPGSIPGQMGTPLAAVDGYYGHQIDPASPESYWSINWDKSDCGYGVGQVTDGMRLAGHEKPGETSLSPALQKAVAVDYATNIAASLKILADKWNEVHAAGQTITVNNDDPAYVENWFTAVWNYNLGFNPPSGASQHAGHWGLGWYNNPANPIYKKSWGHPFMDTVVDGTGANHDAAHPQDWPYEEKVMGWAAWSIDTGYSYATSGRQDWPGESGFSSAGFRPAWWNTTAVRSQVSPPLTTFCNSDNNCDPVTPPNCGNEECYAQFWFNKPNATWKTNCATECGHELIKYQTLIPEPGRGYRLKNGMPVCSGEPTGAHVVASVPNSTETWSDCGQAISSGSFQFTFYPDPLGTHYEAKADLHQVGGGFGGHFWYTHTRNEDHLGGPGGLMDIDGTWTLGEQMDLAQVWVQVPDTGAQTKNAHYVIHGALGGPYDRYLDQADNNGKWVSLGAYKFTSTPSVSLTNYTPGGTGDDDIALGAVAFQPVDGTYVSDSIEADAFFDEDQNIDTRPESSMFNTPLKSRQDLHDWATKTSQKIIGLPTCIDVGSPTCVKPETKAAVEKWNADVEAAGTSTTEHPDGHSIPQWIHFANPYTDRPTSDSKPSWFGTDDAAYKMYNKATVSYIKTSGGKIINGSQSVSYDDRTADTHIPDFVRNFFAALQKDYGTQPPDLDYVAKDLNVHNGQWVTTTTNSDGILPGRAYQSVGVRPVITDDNDKAVTDNSGTCVAVMHTAGGSIGYRPALADQHLTDSVADWVNRVSNDTGSSDNPVALMSQEIRNMFFKPGLTGSIFGQAPPIWQELDFKSCADGTIKKVSGAPVLRSSYMPSQYLYRNGKAIDLGGSYTGSSAPITTGDFYHFSGPATPPSTEDPYSNCTITSGHSGNPWSINISAPSPNPGADPDSTHFCNAPDKTPDPEYTH
ncbi:SGNH/GDSL hydrolase family protein [Streptomyces murinus]|uniref:SGNH/GDSL hydrolase family protein n=1 Tax=Streptomyces murinus TaxID=33900 RepID=UPI003F460EB0